jgi:hypothetical protein
MSKSGKLVGVCNGIWHCGLTDCFTEHDLACEHSQPTQQKCQCSYLPIPHEHSTTQQENNMSKTDKCHCQLDCVEPCLVEWKDTPECIASSIQIAQQKNDQCHCHGNCPGYTQANALCLCLVQACEHCTQQKECKCNGDRGCIYNPTGTPILPTQQKDAGSWEKDFDKWFGHREGKKLRFAYATGVFEEVKAFIREVETQARQQAFQECLEAVGNEEDEDKLKIPVGSSPFYSAERIKYATIALQNRNATRKKIRATIEKLMKQ